MEGDLIPLVDSLIGIAWTSRQALNATGSHLVTKEQQRAIVLEVIAGIEAAGYVIEIPE